MRRRARRILGGFLVGLLALGLHGPAPSRQPWWRSPRRSRPHSAKVHPYALQHLLTLLSIAFLGRGLAGGGRAGWIAYVLATLALLLTHHWSWVLLGAEWAVAGLLVLTAARGSRWPILRRWIASQAAIAVGFAAWAPALLYQFRHTRHPLDPTESLDRALRLFAESMFSLPLHAPAGLALLALLLTAGAALWHGFRVARHRDPDGRSAASVVLLGVPLGAFGIGLASMGQTKLLLTRYLVSLAPLVVLAAAYGIGRLGVRARWAPATVTGAVALAWLVPAAGLGQEVKSNAREVARAVEAEAKPEDLVLIAPEWMAVHEKSGLAKCQADGEGQERREQRRPRRQADAPGDVVGPGPAGSRVVAEAVGTGLFQDDAKGARHRRHRPAGVRAGRSPVIATEHEDRAPEISGGQGRGQDQGQRSQAGRDQVQHIVKPGRELPEVLEGALAVAEHRVGRVDDAIDDRAG